MEIMQKKIKQFENQDKVDNKQADMYNELLIKYNSLLYKANTDPASEEQHSKKQKIIKS